MELCFTIQYIHGHINILRKLGQFRDNMERCGGHTARKRRRLGYGTCAVEGEV
jgi:hypothetical protein